MKTVHVLALLVLSLALVSSAQQQPIAAPAPPVAPVTPAVARPVQPLSLEQERQQVTNVVQQLDDAAIRNDTGFFERVLAPNYVATNAQTRLEHRDDIVNAHKNNDIKYEAVNIRNQQFDVNGRTVIERNTADVRGSYKGKRFDGTYAAERMWVLLPNGNWQMAQMKVDRVK
ncbi:MAG: nuclear transport factor 2 family protein [Terriglobales bacterium]